MKLSYACRRKYAALIRIPMGLVGSARADCNEARGGDSNMVLLEAGGWPKPKGWWRWQNPTDDEVF